MSSEQQFGCKKCGSVVTVEMKPWSDRVDVRIVNGQVRDHFGKIEISCKKCGKPIANVALEKV